MTDRFIKPMIAKSLAKRPAILLLGPRQVGKTWLSRALEQHYVTFDDITTLLQAQDDPVRFVEELPHPTCIDEVQRVPEIFLPIKQVIDKSEQAPNQFLLTGSTNVFQLPKMADSLAGRLRIVRLFPFAQLELEPRPYLSLPDLLWNKQLPELPSPSIDFPRLLVRGGYPIAVRLGEDDVERGQWFSDLIDTIASKDIRDITQVVDGFRSIKLLSLMAARMGSLLNLSEVARSLREPLSTVQRDLAVLKALFLVEEVRAWSGNFSKRLIKSPKIYLNDTGLACHLIGANASRLQQDRHLFGHVLENYVYNELSKQLSWSDVKANIYHFRTSENEEVDFLLERPTGECLAFEVKAAGTITPQDLKGLRSLEAELGEAFIQGVVFYLGKEIKHLGGRLVAIPLSML